MTFEHIVFWQPKATNDQVQKPVKVFAPEIDLAKYTFSYGPETNQAVALTPSMSLTSMSLTSGFYAEELAALQSWYGNPVVMEKYASGATRTAEQTEERYKQLADRWTADFPYSGLMARNQNGEIVGMFNLGYAVDDLGNLRAGTTEFAGVVDPRYWNQGYASEAMILMTVVIKELSDKGYGIEGPLEYVTTAAREDNWAADKALQNSALTFTRKKELHGGIRNVYEASVADIKELIANTQRSRNEEGTFITGPRARL